MMLKYYWWKIRTKIVLFFASKISDGIFINIIIGLLLPRTAYPVMEDVRGTFIRFYTYKEIQNFFKLLKQERERNATEENEEINRRDNRKHDRGVKGVSRFTDHDED
jgi:hypothetical protein